MSSPSPRHNHRQTAEDRAVAVFKELAKELRRHPTAGECARRLGISVACTRTYLSRARTAGVLPTFVNKSVDTRITIGRQSKQLLLAKHQKTRAAVWELAIELDRLISITDIPTDHHAIRVMQRLTKDIAHEIKTHNRAEEALAREIASEKKSEEETPIQRRYQLAKPPFKTEGAA
jgi:hypothetical protein